MLLHLAEPRVHVVRTGQNDLLLQSPASTIANECLRILKVVVASYSLRGHLAGGHRSSVQYRNDADLVGVDFLDRHIALYIEENRVDPIETRRQHRALTAF